jgi:hypothetical protein
MINGMNINGFEEIQKYGKDNVDLALKSADVVTKGFQAIAAETADFTKKSFEAGSSVFEKLLAAPSFDKAVEIQSDYFRSAYEGYVGQVTKFGEIFADMAKGAYKPFEGAFGKIAK